MTKRIDDLLFDSVFQPFAHWFQKMTGADNFFLAYISVAIECALGMIDGMHKEEGLFSGTIGSLISLLAQVGVIWFWERFYKTFSSGRSMAMNPLRVSTILLVIRVFLVSIYTYTLCLILMALTLNMQNLVFMVKSVIFVAGVYFLCCTPLPEQGGRIRKLFAPAT